MSIIFKNNLFLKLCCIVLLGFFNSCSINYSFTGANISPDVKTVSIQYFQNRADIVNPSLSQTFTEALKDKFISQTSLTLVNKNGDLQLEGEITQYKTTPVAIQGNQTAALNRLTITVKVRFVNTKDNTQSYEQSFSRYQDYSSSESLSTVEDGLIKTISETLIEDIFNKAVVNW